MYVKYTYISIYVHTMCTLCVYSTVYSVCSVTQQICDKVLKFVNYISMKLKKASYYLRSIEKNELSLKMVSEEVCLLSSQCLSQHACSTHMYVCGVHVANSLLLIYHHFISQTFLSTIVFYYQHNIKHNKNIKWSH